MLKNYLKIALRNLARHKGYAFINIMGLAVGIAASVLVMLYVVDELGYDRFHGNADRIHRITADWSNKGDSKIHQLGTPWILAKTIRDKYPQVEALTQITGPLGDVVLRKGDDLAFKETEVFAADASFFDVFPFPLVKGDPRTALRDPNAIVLSESLAAKVFGKDDPLGKMIDVQVTGRRTPQRVTAIMRDVPRNTHFRFEMLVSLSTLYPTPSTGWTNNNHITYLLLAKGVTKAQMEEKLVEIDRVEYEGGREHIPWIWTLEPVTRIHLHSDLVTGSQPNGSAAYVRLFTLVALLILVIAGINFVNLATARSARRAREVGIRKVVGSTKSQLVGQFLGESVLLSLVALAFAVGLIQLALPSYRHLAGRALGLPYFGSPWVIPGLVGLALAVGVLAGLYPAFFLSSYKQAEVLKGSRFGGRNRGALTLRNGLVVFQFAMSVLLIIGSLVIGRQLDFIMNQRLGFDKDNIVVIHNVDNLGPSLEAFRERLQQRTDITGVTAVGGIPGWGTPNWGIGVEGVDRERPLNMNFMTCDQDFAGVLDIRMTEGRFLSREHPSDAGGVVINGKAKEYFGLADPVGKKLRIWWTRKDLTIIGVIDDFHFESLHRDVRAMGYLMPEAVNSTRKPFLLAKVRSARTTEVLSSIERSWASLAAGLPFEFSFLDDRIEGLYQNDNRAGKIVSVFSLLSILVSCLGLFGLAAFVTEQRTKEVGIRKILGARPSSILWLHAGPFIRWVALANLIAWPVGYWLMGRWLRGFAMRTSFDAGIFLVSGLAALAVAVVTVSYQVLRAATANPADALRYE
jgi:putative ABC transport system permease protein